MKVCAPVTCRHVCINNFNFIVIIINSKEVKIVIESMITIVCFGIDKTGTKNAVYTTCL